MNLAKTYDKIAEDWHKDHAEDTWWVEETDAFLKRLPEGGTVLDVGCGSGVKSKYMLERGFRVVGIDISDALLAIARRESPSGDFRNVSMYNLDSIQEQFDGVFAQASFLHIPKKDAADVVADGEARCAWRVCVCLGKASARRDARGGDENGGRLRI